MFVFTLQIISTLHSDQHQTYIHSSSSPEQYIIPLKDKNLHSFFPHLYSILTVSFLGFVDVLTSATKRIDLYVILKVRYKSYIVITKATAKLFKH